MLTDQQGSLPGPDSNGSRHSAEVDVSVLVPVRNEERHIAETVLAMRGQRYEGEIEFLFMDGRSTDRTKEILERLAKEDRRVQVIDNPAGRTPNGLNVGLGRARGEYVARMDGHSVYPADYLAKGVERLRRGDVEWVSGPQLPHGEGTWSRGVALALRSRMGVGGSSKWGVGAGGITGGGAEIELDTGVFTGIWRRSTLEAHGGWDEGFPINQDSELAARVRKAGGRLVCLPEIGARYIPRDSLRRLASQYWRFGYYRAKTSRRHPESMRRSHVLAPGLSLVLLASLPGVRPKPISRLARTGLATYGLTVVATSVGAVPRGGARDAATLPSIFPTMHLAWGFGFLAGAARFGPPLASLARIAGLSRSSTPSNGSGTSPATTRSGTAARTHGGSDGS